MSYQIDYSETERALLVLIKKKKRMTAQEAVELYYGKGAKPFYAEQTIRSALSRLQRKVLANAEPFKIELVKEPGLPKVFVFAEKTRARLKA